MIQSGKFDSSNMDIKNLVNSIIIFTIKRLIEITGLIISILGILLFISLISYSSTDPNFIFNENDYSNNQIPGIPKSTQKLSIKYSDNKNLNIIRKETRIIIRIPIQ